MFAHRVSTPRMGQRTLGNTSFTSASFLSFRQFFLRLCFSSSALSNAFAMSDSFARSAFLLRRSGESFLVKGCASRWWAPRLVHLVEFCMQLEFCGPCATG